MTGNITLSYKGNKDENTLIEDMEDDVYEIPDSIFSNLLQEYFIKYIMVSLV